VESEKEEEEKEDKRDISGAILDPPPPVRLKRAQNPSAHELGRNPARFYWSSVATHKSPKSGLGHHGNRIAVIIHTLELSTSVATARQRSRIA
jgi:hypothetical protein